MLCCVLSSPSCPHSLSKRVAPPLILHECIAHTYTHTQIIHTCTHTSSTCTDNHTQSHNHPILQTQAAAIAALSKGGRSLPLQRPHSRSKAALSWLSAFNPPKIHCNAMPWVDCTALRYVCRSHLSAMCSMPWVDCTALQYVCRSHLSVMCSMLPFAVGFVIYTKA